jgi:hypothetical protein
MKNNSLSPIYGCNALALVPACATRATWPPVWIADPAAVPPVVAPSTPAINPAETPAAILPPLESDADWRWYAEQIAFEGRVLLPEVSRNPLTESN